MFLLYKFKFNEWEGDKGYFFILFIERLDCYGDLGNY